LRILMAGSDCIVQHIHLLSLSAYQVIW
jgi:hypothetical protein